VTGFAQSGGAPVDVVGLGAATAVEATYQYAGP
jgi:hypothetical protein